MAHTIEVKTTFLFFSSSDSFYLIASHLFSIKTYKIQNESVRWEAIQHSTYRGCVKEPETKS